MLLHQPGRARCHLFALSLDGGEMMLFEHTIQFPCLVLPLDPFILHMWGGGGGGHTVRGPKLLSNM
jgi:hypothetical protein